MKRKLITLIFSVVACLAFALGLSACGINSSNNPEDMTFTNEGMVYKLLESGDGYEVTDYTDTDTKVYIPATYENLPVTTIGEEAFAWCDSLTEVVIPDSVTTIGYEAFYECTNLTDVVIGDSVTTIGKYAFDWCDSLTKIVIPDSVTMIDASAFVYCDNLTIYCEVESKPGGWDSDWNDYGCLVVWGYKGK